MLVWKLEFQFAKNAPIPGRLRYGAIADIDHFPVDGFKITSIFSTIQLEMIAAHDAPFSAQAGQDIGHFNGIWNEPCRVELDPLHLVREHGRLFAWLSGNGSLVENDFAVTYNADPELWYVGPDINIVVTRQFPGHPAPALHIDQQACSPFFA